MRLVFADSACDPTIASCLPASKENICSAKICFVDSKSKAQFEIENDCKFNNKPCTNEIKEIPMAVLDISVECDKGVN